jgi:two-component system, OmpR family, alkaline phosphatase synthesis response regulator PhoP
MDKKILIVDDEPHLRLLIARALQDLEDEGVELLIANDGEAGLELIQDEHPQLVFLDVMMPKKNGFEVCNTVKHELGMQDVYIILLTAKGQEIDIQHGEQVGANLYLTKPFDPDDLLARAKTILGFE